MYALFDTRNMDSLPEFHALYTEEAARLVSQEFGIPIADWGTADDGFYLIPIAPEEYSEHVSDYVAMILEQD